MEATPLKSEEIEFIQAFKIFCFFQHCYSLLTVPNLAAAQFSLLYQLWSFQNYGQLSSTTLLFYSPSLKEHVKKI